MLIMSIAESFRDLFGLDAAYARLDRSKTDTLVFLNKSVDWESFRPQLESLWRNDRRPKARAVGRPRVDEVLMFKILFLQSIFRTSDRQTEYCCLDRLSWRRFLSLELTSSAPDAKTIWRYRHRKSARAREDGIDLKSLFAEVRSQVKTHGVSIARGRATDISKVRLPTRVAKRNPQPDRSPAKPTSSAGDGVKRANN